MKTLTLLMLAAALLLGGGCVSKEHISKLQGHGSRRLYDASYEPVWNAARAAMLSQDMRVLSADKTTGYISARREMGPTTFGENIGIWVRQIHHGQTQVEVVTRRTGPPVLDFPNLEKLILKSIEDLMPT